MPVQRAAATADELALLRAVVADLSAETPVLVYCDWLDDHDDPRGAFLREFLAAFAARRPLPPDPPGLNPAWADVLALPIRRRLREGYSRSAPGLRDHIREQLPWGFEPVASFFDDLLRSARGCVRLVVGGSRAHDEVPLMTSRAGGLPDLPPDSVWPTEEAADGRRWPIEFLLQLNLSDLRGTLAEGCLPPAGILTLFNYWPPETGLKTRRVWYSAPDVGLTRLAAPSADHWHPGWLDGNEVAVAETYPIVLSDTIRFPRQIPGVPEHYEEPAGSFSPIDLCHLLLENWIETRPARHNIVCGPSDVNYCGALEHILGMQPIGPYLELFELWSNAGPDGGWCFGDGGQLHVFVPSDDAGRGVFDRAVVVDEF